MENTLYCMLYFRNKKEWRKYSVSKIGNVRWNTAEKVGNTVLAGLFFLGFGLERFLGKKKRQKEKACGVRNTSAAL